MTKEDAVEKIQKSKGRIFSVIFTKKNGEVRRMTARLHVTRCVKGVGMSYDPKSKGLITVFDMRARGFRHVNINTMTHFNGEKIVSNHIVKRD